MWRIIVIYALRCVLGVVDLMDLMDFGGVLRQIGPFHWSRATGSGLGWFFRYIHPCQDRRKIHYQLTSLINQLNQWLASIHGSVDQYWVNQLVGWGSYQSTIASTMKSMVDCCGHWPQSTHTMTKHLNSKIHHIRVIQFSLFNLRPISAYEAMTTWIKSFLLRFRFDATRSQSSTLRAQLSLRVCSCLIPPDGTFGNMMSCLIASSLWCKISCLTMPSTKSGILENQSHVLTSLLRRCSLVFRTFICDSAIASRSRASSVYALKSDDVASMIFTSLRFLSMATRIAFSDSVDFSAAATRLSIHAHGCSPVVEKKLAKSSRHSPGVTRSIALSWSKWSAVAITKTPQLISSCCRTLGKGSMSTVASLGRRFCRLRKRRTISQAISEGPLGS